MNHPSPKSSPVLHASLVAATFSVMLMLGAGEAHAGPRADVALRGFVHAMDAQNVSAADAALHETFRTLVFMPGKDAPMVLDRNAYLGMLKKKKLGGDKRSVEVHAVLQNKHSVVVHATYRGKRAVFYSTTTWVKSGGKLKLANETVEFHPEGAPQ